MVVTSDWVTEARKPEVCLLSGDEVTVMEWDQKTRTKLRGAASASFFCSPGGPQLGEGRQQKRGRSRAEAK